jgi:hypothetical protein
MNKKRCFFSSNTLNHLWMNILKYIFLHDVLEQKDYLILHDSIVKFSQNVQSLGAAPVNTHVFKIASVWTINRDF